MSPPAAATRTPLWSTAFAASAVFVLSLLASACAPALIKLPTGPGASATDAGDALAQATQVCRSLSTMSGVATARGSVNGQRLRANLIVGVAAPSSARLEAVASGQRIFIFVSRENDATLLLQQDNPNRVLPHGPPADVLEAVTGVPLDPIGLRATLTGCPLKPDAARGVAFGNDWRMVPDVGDVAGAQAYLHRASPTAPWQIVTIVYRGRTGRGWRADYSDFNEGLPLAIRLKSDDSKTFDLRLALDKSQVETNVPLGDEVFRIQVPSSADPITLDELRRAGPLGGGSNGR